MSIVQGERDLDGLVTASDQVRWLLDPYRVNAEERSEPPLELPRSQVERYAARYGVFLDHPNARAAVELLGHFLAGSVPFPRATEYSFWTVSCMPSTATQFGPRLLCVHAGVIELLVVSPGGRNDSDAAWGYVNVASDVLIEEFGHECGYWRQLEGTELYWGGYQFSGDKQATLFTSHESDLLGVLRDPRIQRAAGAFALRMMRKRTTIYQRYHCKQLADAAHAVNATTPERRW